MIITPKPMCETLTIEFKSDQKCLSLSSLVEALVGMANTNGGKLFLGMEDDGTPTGVNSQHRNIISLIAYIQDHTVPSLYVNASIEPINGVDVLIIDIPVSRQLMMTSEGKYLRRRIDQKGKPENLAMKPHEIMQRMSYIQAMDPSAQTIDELAPGDAFSSLERDRLRNMVGIYHGDSSLLGLSDDELDRALGFVKLRNGRDVPTITGILMIGKEEIIRQFIPSHEVLFQVLDGMDVLVNTPAMHSSLLHIFETVNLLFQARIVEQEIQVGLFRVPVPNYEKDAFREGFVNALVHRDYYRAGAVIVQLQTKSMQIVSPGGFVEGINPDNILNAAPTPRNILLAEAAKRIGLAERTGRGVPKIYNAMLRSGHSLPDYSSSDCTKVSLRLNSSELDERFIKMMVTEEQRTQNIFSVDSLIVLSSLREERRCSLKSLSVQLQKKESEAKSTVEHLVELGMVEGIGNGSARKYILSSKVYTLTENKAGYTRQKGWTVIQEKEMVLSHFTSFSQITRKEVEDLCRCSKDHAYWILKTLVKDGKLMLHGQGKSVFYTKVCE